MRAAALVTAALSAAACGGPEGGAAGADQEATARTAAVRPQSPLPDPSGWGTHLLALAVAPDGAVWVGTYGEGIYVRRPDATEWERITPGDSSISWGFVNAFAFAGDAVWYGTVGNGWGVSRDGGRTWRNWTFSDLGPRWQYVAPDGIAAVGDTVYVATADGLRITPDGGETWREVTDDNGLPNKYLLAMTAVGAEEGVTLRVWHLRGVSESPDGGRTWNDVRVMGGEETRTALREMTTASDAACDRSELTRELCAWREAFRRYPAPDAPLAEPVEREHFWFARAVKPEDNPRLDQTYTYGSTMGGNFQQHQGVEFNVPEGTPIHAIGDGVVAMAGSAEAGSNTVVIRHDRTLDGQAIWSTYYHNSALRVAAGDTVREGELIALAGNTGRATNDHLHLEVHVTPADAGVADVADPEQRYPPYTRNPQLWIRPLPGTGAIAGRVLDTAGEPLPGARVYGVVKPDPRETPFSFAETYEDRAHPDLLFGENFAIGDVPAGEWVLGAEIDGRRVFRRVRVEADRVTEVILRP